MSTSANSEASATIPGRSTRVFTWIRGHRLADAGISALVIGIIAIVAVAAFPSGSAKKKPMPTVSKNAVIAGYQTQLPALAEAVRKNPRDAAALAGYGVALYATGDVNRARQQYEAELKISPSDPVLLNNLGNVYRDLGTYDKALASYQKSIKINPKSATAYVNLANLYTYTLRKKPLGIQTILDARKNLSDNADLGVLLGIAYEQSGDKVRARAAFNTVLKTNPTSAAARAGLARVK